MYGNVSERLLVCAGLDAPDQRRRCRGRPPQPARQRHGVDHRRLHEGADPRLDRGDGSGGARPVGAQVGRLGDWEIHRDGRCAARLGVHQADQGLTL